MKESRYGSEFEEAPLFQSYAPKGREEEFSSLVKLAGKKSIAILGERGLGKGYLIENYVKMVDRKRQYRVIRVECKKNKAPFHVFNKISKELLKKDVFDEDMFKSVQDVAIIVDGRTYLPKETEKDIEHSMLTAVSDFVKDYFRNKSEKEERGVKIDFDKVRVGVVEEEESKIIHATFGGVMFLAEIVGKLTETIRRRVRETATYLKEEYGEELSTWDGDMSKVSKDIEEELKNFRGRIQDFTAIDDNVRLAASEINKQREDLFKKKTDDSPGDLVILENIQNLDLETLKLLDAVVKKKKGVFITTRATDVKVEKTERDYIEKIEGMCSKIKVGGYSFSDLEDIVNNILTRYKVKHVSGKKKKELMVFCKGNPSRIEELLENMTPRQRVRGDITTSLDDQVMNSIKYLSKPSRKLSVLQLLAVIGRPVRSRNFTKLCRKTGCHYKLKKQVNELRKTKFIKIERDERGVQRARFFNPRVQGIIYKRLGKDMREALHKDLGTWFKKQGVSEYTEEIAYHFKNAKRPDLAIKFIIKNAEEKYLDTYDAGDLLVDYKDAIEVAEEVKVPINEYISLYTRLYDAAVLINDTSVLKEYSERLEKAVEGAPEIAKRRADIKIGLFFSSIYRHEGALEKRKELLQEKIADGLNVLTDRKNKKYRQDTYRDLGYLYYYLAWSHRDLMELNDALDTIKKGIKCLGKKGLREVLAQLWYGYAVVYREIDLERSFEYTKRAIRLVGKNLNLKTKFISNLASSYNYLGDRELHLGDKNNADGAYSKSIYESHKGVNLSIRTNNEMSSIFFYQNLAEALVKRGEPNDLKNALPILKKAKTLAQDHNEWQELFYIKSTYGMLLSRRKDVRRMCVLYKEVLDELKHPKEGQNASALKVIRQDISFEYAVELRRHEQTRDASVEHFKYVLTVADEKSWMYAACVKYLFKHAKILLEAPETRKDARTLFRYITEVADSKSPIYTASIKQLEGL